METPSQAISGLCEAVLGVGAGGATPSRHGSPGYNPRKIFEIVNARR
jgi:hypothetical protein